MDQFASHDNSEETLSALELAVTLANDKSVRPGPEVVDRLGEGWIAEEALTISLYCSLVHEENFKEAVLLAINHSGDSDSTGAITGNILGALLARNAIPENWLAQLELRDVIEEIAQDLLTTFRDDDGWWQKYPGW